jgi:hypothetical protein
MSKELAASKPATHELRIYNAQQALTGMTYINPQKCQEGRICIRERNTLSLDLPGRRQSLTPDQTPSLSITR